MGVIMLEHHHLKYKEIDGYDKTILVSRSEHKKINNAARLKRGYPIPHKIHRNAASRIMNKKMEKSTFWFDTQIDNRAAFREKVKYNQNNGNIYFAFWWRKN
jgi:hypothetical protein